MSAPGSRAARSGAEAAADRAQRRRAVRAVLAVLVALGTLASLTGCVGLPTTSTVVQDTNPATEDGGADIRVWPQPPAPGDSPRDIVEGFLQTAASDPSNLRIATQYLTAAAAKNWDPAKVVVFGDESPPEPVLGSPGDYQIVGPVVGKVTDSGSYVASTSSDTTRYTFHVTGNAKQGYRIDSLPSDFGIALQQEVFRADYAEYNLYYLNDDAPTESMIPVPLYLRSQYPDAAVATQLANALFHGMPTWLTGAGRLASSAPALAGPVTISQDDVAHVTLAAAHSCDAHAAQASVSPQSAAANERVCDQLADELLATFDGVASISAVEVQSPGGVALGTAQDADAVMRQYHIEGAGSKQPQGAVYYLDSAHQQVARSTPEGSTATPIGPATARYSQLAVTTLPGQSSATAALVDSTGTKLYLGAPGESSIGDPVFTGSDITSLSWDALGHLWFVADQDGTATVFRLDPTASPRTPPQAVLLLSQFDGPVQRIAVAPDGRRVAVSYVGPAGASIALGIAEHDGPGWTLDFDYPGEQPLVADWSQVSDLRWRGGQVLTVLGTQQTSSPTVYAFYPDGSPVVNATDLSSVMITPPKDAVAIAWAAGGSTLLATSQPTGTGTASPDSSGAQIEVYSSTSAVWTPLVSGTSPAPQN